MFKKSLGILFATTVIATAPSFALAADDFTAAQHDSWTGAYIGVAVGAGGGVADLALGGGLVSLEGIGGEGVLGSIYIGYDWQITPNIVVGAMADYTFSNIETTLSIPALAFNANVESDRSFSVLARAGYLTGPNTLAYALAGWTRQYSSLNTNVGFGVNLDANGWVVGTGLEHRITSDLSLKLEYRYTQLDDISLLGGLLNVDATQHTARLGLAYRWSNPEGVTPDSDPVDYNWTGFYVGGGLGAVTHTGELSVAGLATFDGIGGDGGRAGLFIGYDHQVNNNIVVGIEAGVTASNAEFDINLLGINLFNIEESTQYSVTGRLGWLPSEDTMIYGLAGWSWTDFDVSIPPIAFAADFDYDGFTVGAGIEHALTDNITTRLEYRFTDYGTEGIPVLGATLNTDPSNHAVMGSLSYKFRP